MDSRQDPTLIALILETFGALCRLPENSLEFGSLGGVEYMIQAITDWGPSTVEVLKAGARAMGVVARSPENAEALIANDALTILTSILNGEYYNDEASVYTQFEVAMACFKSIRKLITNYNDPESFSQYMCGGGADTWVWFLETLAGVDDPLSALILELFGVGCGLMWLLSPGMDECANDTPIRDLIDPPPPDRPRTYHKGTYDRFTPQPAPTFADLMGLDTAKACSVIANTACIMETESFKQNARVMCNGMFLISNLVSNIPSIEGMTEEVVAGEGELAYTLITMQKKLALVIDALHKMTPEFYEMIYQMIANFGYNFGGEALAAHFPADGDLFVSMSKDIAKKATSEKDKQLKKQCGEFMVVWKAAAKGGQADQLFEPYVQLHQDVDRLAKWSTDAYENGVQDLEFKDRLREGGKVEMVGADKARVQIYWRASQVLKHLQWRRVDEEGVKAPQEESTGKKLKNLFKKKSDVSGGTKGSKSIDLGVLEFKNQTPIGKVRITKGLETLALRELGKNPLSGVRADYCLSIVGPPTEDSPQGDELGLILKSKKERDELYAMFFEWKTAATS
eukprot:Blabericola_migrator_1__388@NODE_1098_length_5442_cov_73_354791_g648_i2_p2_GENE_NODE_1098_length_5442_cov_73_354791_g648_i2NODE_1098_length_5442_cov_73_354791_g648_i2_p2_ORF_typecomplete_len569_score139_36Globin/PF00042_22/36Globin/PF00042_22/1_9Globin/PF00042_22/1_4e04_NODE_1098_length_5442_cov_73_354791_g648_i226654371